MLLEQFQATYGKPLLAARDPKCSAKDAEAGALAMEALHKQVNFNFFGRKLSLKKKKVIQSVGWYILGNVSSS